jgi:hypothetical protein
MTSKSRMLRLAATLSCSIALTAGVGAPAHALLASTASPGSAAFLGVWNYQTPDPATGLNIAVVGGHGFTENFPQIGWVDFTRGRAAPIRAAPGSSPSSRANCSSRTRDSNASTRSSAPGTRWTAGRSA